MNQKKSKTKKNTQNDSINEQVLKRRRRNVLLLMGEIALCLLLCIGCFGVNILNSYAYEELDKDVYKATTGTRTATKIIEVTDDNGSVVETKSIDITYSSNMQEYRNILVIGLDARSQDSMDQGTNSDVMIVVSINNKTGDIRMISILRDTILKMETGSKAYNKANNQFALSGISDTVSMVNRNLDLNIDSYVIVNWYAVAQLVDMLGGIEMTVPNETIMNYMNGYLTDVVEKTGIGGVQLTEPGTYNLSGSQVVALCRVRYGGLNDTGRTENQRTAITKIFEKAKYYAEIGDFNTLINCAEVGLNNVRTNMTLSDILALVVNATDYSMTGNQQFPLDYTTASVLGSYYAKYGVMDPLVANDFAAEVTEVHKFLFNEEDYIPSDDVQNFSYQMMLDRQ